MAEISAELIARITAAGQQHVLRFFDELANDEQENLKSQLEAVNWEFLPFLLG